MSYVLDCYDHLEGSLRHAWLALVRGAADRRHAFHTPVVATLGLDGTPEARTVVLRSADAERWRLTFHTDARSEKFREIARDPRISITAYDAASKIQVRCRGSATCHVGDPQASAAWGRSRPESRSCYRQVEAPGMLLESPKLADPVLDAEGDAPSANFVQVEVFVTEIEWLYLAHSGHRRARFSRSPEGALVSTWIAP